MSGMDGSVVGRVVLRGPCGPSWLCEMQRNQGAPAARAAPTAQPRGSDGPRLGGGIYSSCATVLTKVLSASHLTKQASG